MKTKSEIARVAHEVSKQYLNESRSWREEGDTARADAKYEVSEAFKYFAELIKTSGL